MKNGLSPMILAEPAGLQWHPPWLRLARSVSDKDFLQLSKPLGKIGEEFSSNFALVAARPQDAGNKNPAWNLGAQWEEEPFGGAFTAFP